MDIDMLGRVAGTPEAIAELRRECMHHRVRRQLQADMDGK